jgi:hypothetical protein
MRALRRLAAGSAASACLAFIAMLAGCDLKESRDEFLLTFRNPAVTENLDSLLVYGINQPGGDTLLVLRWTRGRPFPTEVPYPDGLGKDFDLLAQGFAGGEIIRQTRTAVSGGQAGPVAYERLLHPPDLADTAVDLPFRYGDSVVLAPVWKRRPGWEEKEFRPEGSYAWKKDGKVLSRDSLLALTSLVWSDSGTYTFASENAAGRDTLEFRVSLRHRIPRILAPPDRASLADQPLAIRPAIVHSDALLYRWLKGNVLVSEDSVLSIPAFKAGNAGAYRLEVRNVSDTSESAQAAFRIVLAGRIPKWDALKWDGDVWW